MDTVSGTAKASPLPQRGWFITVLFKGGVEATVFCHDMGGPFRPDLAESRLAQLGWLTTGHWSQSGSVYESVVARGHTGE